MFLVDLKTPKCLLWANENNRKVSCTFLPNWIRGHRWNTCICLDYHEIHQKALNAVLKGPFGDHFLMLVEVLQLYQVLLKKNVLYYFFTTDFKYLLVMSPNRAGSSHSSSWRIFGSSRDLFPFSSKSKIDRKRPEILILFLWLLILIEWD